MRNKHEEMRKITVNLPASLLNGLAEDEDKTLTEVLQDALKQYRHRRACQALLALKGKVKFDLTYEEIKEDRE